MIQIGEGLNEVAHLAHRDLKPGNVLLRNGVWKIGDFGIARFVEESTSLRTLKDCLSSHYAAPEQWRLEHASEATDIYGLAGIGYALITGKPPFNGSPEQLKEAHCHGVAPVCQGASAGLQSLLHHMLRKILGTRHTRERVLARLAALLADANKQTTIGARLRMVDASVSAKELEKQARHAEELAARKERDQLFLSATEMLNDVADQLARRIESDAPNALPYERRTPIVRHLCRLSGSVEDLIWSFRLNDARVDLIRPRKTKIIDRRVGWFNRDVLCYAAIAISLQIGDYESKELTSSSLYYMDNDGGFRWMEVKFESTQERYLGAVAIDPHDLFGDQSRYYQLVYGPIPLDDEDAEEFIARWLDSFAEAAAA